jgi:hypothetical protein
MKPGLLLNRWAREGELPPSPAPHPQKQNLAVYTKELTHLCQICKLVAAVGGWLMNHAHAPAALLLKSWSWTCLKRLLAKYRDFTNNPVVGVNA